ncbi:MAG TPA: hypothetical protein DGR97_09780 [Gammaproteobacteria bacterium]|nr:hypothetical protein [Gammaproteobacteria bacterium]
MKVLQTMLFSAFYLISLASYAVTTPDVHYIAKLFSTAQKSSAYFPDIIKINPYLEESLLYEIQKRFVALKVEDGSSIAGYKGGFIPKAPIGGVLFSNGMLRGLETIKRANFQSLLIEAEIAFKFCQSISAPISNIAALKSSTCSVSPAVELPDAAFRNLDQLKQDVIHLRRLLIPTNVAASHLLLGDGMEPDAVDLDRLDIKVDLNNTQIGFREGMDSNNNIWAQVLWVINDFVIANGYTITPDQVIIPGSLTGLHPGRTGNYRVDYGALGTIEFEVR